MTMNRRRRALPLVALGLVGLMTIAGCASAASEESGDTRAIDREVGFIGVEEAGAPVDGGTLTFGSYVFPTVLDPTKTRSAGSVGGTELAAIYDTLVRSDYESGGFEPRLAERLTNNDDFTQFTVELRDGAKFSDGSPVDSAAVKWSMERYIAANFDLAATFSNVLSSIDTPDPSTVVFNLENSWSRFPVMLAMGPGYIVAPSSEAGGAFKPIGAGPFTLTKFAPNEEIIMTARADYFGGKPHLDGLRFVPTAGAQSQLDSLESGQLDMSYILLDETTIKNTLDRGYAGFRDIQGLGQNVILNQREGRPGADLRVRQAVAYGIDPEIFNSRAHNGLGIVDSNLLPATSRWSSTVDGIPYDPEKAKQFLAEAKADGYDGKLKLLTPTEQFSMQAALAVQASLNAIGFDVQLDTVGSASDSNRRVFAEHDFDVVRSAFAFLDDAPLLRLQGSMMSDSSNNPQGYADAQMDELIRGVQTALTDEDKNAALSKVQQRMNETIPYAVLGPMSVLTAWDDNVHGVERTVDNIWYFDTAWLSKN
ncbi:ABC transporter substrate-binding protein [Prescottella defluvii]|uniref:ABC transporter substrate-binding protein n=1 Tax=Prescottella defluvii TaxID=1323361 RepID=UPI0004F3C364|nr:ABC transporter substrate-binding protein [Prescottella defluvii]